MKGVEKPEEMGINEHDHLYIQIPDDSIIHHVEDPADDLYFLDEYANLLILMGATVRLHLKQNNKK